MLKKIRISDIDLSQDGNIREELGDMDGLASSIEKKGLIYPIKVRTGATSLYEIIDGYRRVQAFLRLEIEEIDADDLGEVSDDERDFIQYIANEQSKYNTWWEKAKFYKRKSDGGLSNSKIAKEIGSTKDIVESHLMAYRLSETTLRGVKSLSLSMARIISSVPKEDWKLLIDKVIEDKVDIHAMEKMIKNSADMKYRLELIVDTHPTVYKMLYDFWYPLRYQIGSCGDMTEEADLRMGNPHRIERYFDAEEITEEEAIQKAEEQHGEFRGVKVFRRYVIYGLKRTAEEIREKWT